MLFFSCILILALIPTLNGAFLKQLSQLSENSQIFNNSYFEYAMMNQTNKMLASQRNNVNDFVTNGKGGDTKANLTALSWAHAVNSQQKLSDALTSDIDYIEADIVMGKLNNSDANIPIMAHPPATRSDLSLDSFLLQIKDYNSKHPHKMKGVKLDFKSIEVFEGAMKTLKEKIPQMSYPIWLNADIIRGPVNDTLTTPVNPEQFFAGCAQFKKAVLSIGWTTKWSSAYNNGSYTREETDAMLESIRTNNVTQTGQPITFPVRAGIAANSLDELHDLVKAVNVTNACTLTIWSSQDDFVNIEKLRKLIFSFGFDRVYLDVPPDVANQLDLSRPLGVEIDSDCGKNRSNNSKVLFSFLNFTLMTIGIVLFNMWTQKDHV